MRNINIITVLMLLLFACTTKKATTDKKEESTALPQEVTFENHIKPIALSFCGGSYCHHGKPSYYATYANIKEAVDNGSIKKLVIEKRVMPKFKKLPEEEYELFKKWIETGAKEK